MVTFPCLYHYNAKYVLFKKTKQNYVICMLHPNRFFIRKKTGLLKS